VQQRRVEGKLAGRDVDFAAFAQEADVFKVAQVRAQCAVCAYLHQGHSFVFHTVLDPQAQTEVGLEKQAKRAGGGAKAALAGRMRS
jgi:hypothetical protein